MHMQCRGGGNIKRHVRLHGRRRTDCSISNGCKHTAHWSPTSAQAPVQKYGAENKSASVEEAEGKNKRKGEEAGKRGGGGGAIATATESNTERRTFIIRFDDVDSEPLEKFCRIVRVLPTLSHHRGQLQHSQQHT